MLSTLLPESQVSEPKNSWDFFGFSACFVFIFFDGLGFFLLYFRIPCSPLESF